MDIDFRITYYKISRGLHPITLSESATTRKAKAMILPFVDAEDMVDKMFPDKKVRACSRRIKKLEPRIAVLPLFNAGKKRCDQY
jgi:hypothetical protein